VENFLAEFFVGFFVFYVHEWRKVTRWLEVLNIRRADFHQLHGVFSLDKLEWLLTVNRYAVLAL